MCAAPRSTGSISATASCSTSIRGRASAGPTSCAAAREVRERLAAIDLESFVKLSGGKGVHVVLPVAPVDWETVKTFVQAFAQAMAADDPDALRRQDDEVAPQGKNLRRLFPQLAGADLGRRLFDAGARRRAGVGAGDLGRARPRQIGEPVHAAQSRQAARLAQARSVGRHRPRQAEAAGSRDLRKRR